MGEHFCLKFGLISYLERIFHLKMINNRIKKELEEKSLEMF